MTSLQMKKTVKNVKLIASTNENNNSFVGLRIKGNEVEIHYPYCYGLEKDDNNTAFVDDVLNLLKSFSLAKSSSTEIVESPKNRGKDNYALNSYLWVIADFLKKGFYINREKVYKSNDSGRVNWKKTIEQQPLISNGNIVFSNFIVEKKQSIDNKIVEIHKYCVKKSIDFLGWLFKLDSSFIDVMEVTPTMKNEYEIIIQEELYKTFDDYKKELFENLLNVLVGLDEYNENDSYSYGVDQYHVVYEAMINRVFGNKNPKDFYPKGHWVLINRDNIPFNSSSLRPDSVFVDEDNKKAYVVDAKYYQFGINGSVTKLPNTSDIQKQIAYGEYVQKLLHDYKIYNAFIMPYDKQNNPFNSSDNIIYVGYAMSDVQNDSSQKQYHYIPTFLVDLKYIVKTYNYYNHNDDIKSLTSSIITEVERIISTE